MAERHGVRVVYVTNGGIRPSRHPLASVVVVEQGADAADRWIAERIGPGDVCVTADVPLAARFVEAGAPGGGAGRSAFTARTVGERLAMRDLMADLRAADPFRQGGGRAFRPADRARFKESARADARGERLTRARKARSPSIARQVERGRDRHPDRVVARLGGRAEAVDRAGEVDVADLVRPDAVLGHPGVALPGAEPADDGDAPAGLLEALAVQRPERALARVDAAAGELELAAAAASAR